MRSERESRRSEIKALLTAVEARIEGASDGEDWRVIAGQLATAMRLAVKQTRPVPTGPRQKFTTDALSAPVSEHPGPRPPRPYGKRKRL